MARVFNKHLKFTAPHGESKNKLERTAKHFKRLLIQKRKVSDPPHRNLSSRDPEQQEPGGSSAGSRVQSPADRPETLDSEEPEIFLEARV